MIILFSLLLQEYKNGIHHFIQTIILSGILLQTFQKLIIFARSAYYVPVPVNVNVRLSVRPSVRVCVCVSVRHRFLRFLRRAYGPVTPSDPLRKTSTLVSPDPFENLSTYTMS